MKRLVAILLALMAVPAGADDLVTGDELHQLFARHDTLAAGELTSFRADGALLHNGAPAGRWDIRGDQYCDHWDNVGAWRCFDIAVSDLGDGDRELVWIAADGAEFREILVERPPAERRLSGAEIAALLPMFVARTGTTWQRFEADGTTRYHDRGRDTRGLWEVRGNTYCSHWGGSGPGAWACYEVWLDATETRLTWVGETGQRIENTIEPRE